MPADRARRRVVLVEMDLPAPTWSSRALETVLLKAIPHMRPVVLGSIAAKEVDATYRKIRQLARETEDDRSKADRVHSAHKALSFFQDMFSDRFWRWGEIGQPQSRRRRLIAPIDTEVTPDAD